MSTQAIRWGLGRYGFVWCLIYVVAGTAVGEPIVLPEVPPPNPDNPVDYQALIRRTLAPNLADEDNAIGDYIKAYEQIEPFEGDWGRTIWEPWSENAEVEKWLRQNRAGLEAFKRAAQREAAYFDKAGIEAHTKKLEDFELSWRHDAAIEGLCAEGFRDWAAGQTDTLFDNALLLLRSSKHLGSSPTLTGYGGKRSLRYGYDTLRVALDLSDDREDHAQRVWPELRGIGAAELPLELQLWMDRVKAYEQAQEDASIAAHVPAIQAYYDAYERRLKTPFWRREFSADASVPGVPDLPEELGLITTPFICGAELTTPVTTAKRRATHLVYALHVHKAEHGKFPRRLDELEVRELDQLRVDPFSGEDFVYKKRRGSFKLYSVWLNCRDNGGKHGEGFEDLDHVLWPYQPPKPVSPEVLKSLMPGIESD